MLALKQVGERRVHRGLVASDATAVLTAGTANITGFHYVGNVNVPTAAGSQQMMEFTADSIDLKIGRASCRERV